MNAATYDLELPLDRMRVRPRAEIIQKTVPRVYLAGPMTGIPQFNFPAFDGNAAALRSLGFTVVSPAELDNEETRAAALASPDGSPGSGSTNGETWGDFLARDVKIVADKVDGVVAMDGWYRSKGARLETFIAYVCGKPVYSLPHLKEVSRWRLAKAWLFAR